jgi:hypothetical protein
MSKKNGSDSLLSAAKAVARTPKPRGPATDRDEGQLLDLAVALFRGEVTPVQAATVLYCGSRRSAAIGNATSVLSSCLRRAVAAGKVVIEVV